jgi:phage I-like protein
VHIKLSDDGDVKAMGYWVDLNQVELDESNGSWIHAMTVGKYEHPVYGTIEFTVDRLKRFAQGVMNKVRGIDLDIDYDHKARGGQAAGWVQKAEVRSDGLWIFVEWTKEAAGLIREKAYRYFSPEFVDEWKHPKTGAVHKDVLLGGGLTNRPFLKDLLPVNMSEIFADTSAEQRFREGGPLMTPEQLKKLSKSLGLSEDASVEDILAAAASKDDKTEDEKKKVEGQQDQQPETDKDKQVQPVAASEVLQKLSESDDPTLKALGELVRSQQETIVSLSAQNYLVQTEGLLARLSETAASKGRALPPVVVDKLRAALPKVQLSERDSVVEALAKLCEEGFVELNEVGHAGAGSTGSADGAQPFLTAVQRFSEANKDVPYAEAVQTVAAQNPQLFADYRTATFAGSDR